MPTIIPLIAILFPLKALLFAPTITVEQEYPTVGRATTIIVSEPVDELTITYRPDAPAVKVVEILPSMGTTTIVWRPLHPGVVKIEAAGATKELSVRFDGVPISGVLVMLIAGSILFGGAVWSTRQLLGPDLPRATDLDD